MGEEQATDLLMALLKVSDGWEQPFRESNDRETLSQSELLSPLASFQPQVQQANTRPLNGQAHCGRELCNRRGAG